MERNQQHYLDKIVIPYFWYSDEFEVCDPLGANAGTHKVCGFYFNFPTIPSHHLSHVENIFVAAFVKSHDFSQHGVEKSVKPIVEVLKRLEQEGLDINVEGEIIHVYFVLGTILGKSKLN